MRASRITATLVVAGLAAATVFGSQGEGSAPPNQPIQFVAATLPVVTQAPASAPRPTNPALTSSPESVDALIVIEEGLAAWGRFAVTGDVDSLQPWFDVDGPQHVLLVKEAAKLAADPLGAPAYSVVMADPRREHGGGDRTRVTGRVVFARTGEPSQSFNWGIVLHRSATGWRIWTVEELPEP